MSRRSYLRITSFMASYMPLHPTTGYPNAKSICDARQVGAGQQSVSDLLAQTQVSFHEEPAGNRGWLVEGSNSQCKLWVDDSFHLLKKRKAIVTENGSWSVSEGEKQTQAPHGSAGVSQSSTAQHCRNSIEISRQGEENLHQRRHQELALRSFRWSSISTPIRSTTATPVVSIKCASPRR